MPNNNNNISGKKSRFQHLKVLLSYFILLIFVSSLWSCRSHKQGISLSSASPVPPPSTGSLAKNAMVVSAHPLASKAGLEVLQRGGNAVDAAIAVHFVLAVAFPVAGNIGGGGFAVYKPINGQPATLDFREKAPAAASRNMFLDAQGQPVAQLSLYSHLASGVPGSVAGMWALHQQYGSMPWSELLRPAINMAANGVPFLSATIPNELNNLASEITKYNTQPNAFLQPPNGVKWLPTDTLRQPDLAQTLLRIQQQGANGFYQGKTAQLIANEMQRRGGLITLSELGNYQPQWRKPLVGNYKDLQLITMPPPSSGGVALLQLLTLLERNLPPFLPAKHSKNQVHDPQIMHLIAEAERLVYADRSKYLGDPDFYPVPVDGLLNPDYLSQRWALFHPDKATLSHQILPGNPGDTTSTDNRFHPEKGTKKLQNTNLPKTPTESEETTHFSIVDKFGNAIAITTTLNDSYGSRVVVGGAGFLLNNEMDDFSLKPGVPNMYGLVGGEANAIAPQKRMLSSMTPTIILRNGQLYMVVGSPGGSTIITSVLQTILNVYEFDMTLQTAVNTPRYHHQWRPDTLFYEVNHFADTTLQQLKKMGHNPIPRKPIGRVDAILKRPADGLLEGATDPRGEGAALGF